MPLKISTLFDEGENNEVYNVIKLWRCGCWIREIYNLLNKSNSKMQNWLV